MSNTNSERGRNVPASAETTQAQPNAPDSPRTLVKATLTLASGTMASRILGFVRDIILAKLFGTGFRAEVFFLAQRIPNLFRDMVGEGAANSAVVPVLSEYQAKNDPKEFWRLVNCRIFANCGWFWSVKYYVCFGKRAHKFNWNSKIIGSKKQVYLVSVFI